MQAACHEHAGKLRYHDESSLTSHSAGFSDYRSRPIMKKQIRSRDITGRMILLGTGTSVGVPALGCSCPVCTGRRPRNVRTRASAILGLPGGNLLVDTSPDLRMQLLREEIGMVHAVAYTHEHADHIAGFDDLRLFQFYLGNAVPVYCNTVVRDRLERSFDYAFADSEPTHPGAVPAVEIHSVGQEPFEVLGATVTPIPLEHGPKFSVLGFRVGNVAYCTDVKTVPESSWPLLEGLDTLVIDALRPLPHPTHMCIDEAIDVARQLRPRQTWFTHCSCYLDWYEVTPTLPPGIGVGYDGLEIPLVQ